MAGDVRSATVGRAIGPQRTRRTPRKAKESRSSVPIQQTLLGVILTPDLIRGKPSTELRHDQGGTRAGTAAPDLAAEQSGAAARRPPGQRRDSNTRFSWECSPAGAPLRRDRCGNWSRPKVAPTVQSTAHGRWATSRRHGWLAFPIPDPRSPIPESRSPNPESRIPNPESRVPSPESRQPTTRTHFPVDGS